MKFTFTTASLSHSKYRRSRVEVGVDGKIDLVSLWGSLQPSVHCHLSVLDIDFCFDSDQDVSFNFRQEMEKCVTKGIGTMVLLQSPQ